MTSYIPVAEITVKQLGEQLRQPNASAPVQLVDVREPEEWAIARLDGFINLPLSQFPTWSEQIHVHLDPQVETIVLCHHGIRSAQLCQWLLHQGFSQVKNVRGGIDAYADYVDRSIPRY
ncbi:MAG: rhodanese-related sulfurtransferase [Leptolyngbyaceae cyanobacterium SL_7_1]|nr:rhodanese-related sulfurtransferase [Leptolyngbyaceae cyanobacterium SL_7_1]